MALKKVIMTRDNLPLSYHRIFQIIEEVNFETAVYVKSYLDEQSRLREKNGEPAYFKTNYITIEGHDGSITAEDAYVWLKENRPEFKGAEDV